VVGFTIIPVAVAEVGMRLVVLGVLAVVRLALLAPIMQQQEPITLVVAVAVLKMETALTVAPVW
jgi:hypothetical protein